jgi:hypothetical protein
MAPPLSLCFLVSVRSGRALVTGDICSPPRLAPPGRTPSLSVRPLPVRQHPVPVRQHPVPVCGRPGPTAPAAVGSCDHPAVSVHAAAPAARRGRATLPAGAARHSRPPAPSPPPADAMKPRTHGVRTRWIRGFIAWARVSLEQQSGLKSLWNHPQWTGGAEAAFMSISSSLIAPAFRSRSACAPNATPALSPARAKPSITIACRCTPYEGGFDTHGSDRPPQPDPAGLVPRSNGPRFAFFPRVLATRSRK